MRQRAIPGRNAVVLGVGLLLAGVLAGCGGGSTGTTPEGKEASAASVQAPAKAESQPPAGRSASNESTTKKPSLAELTADPRACVAAFLEAIRQGDDQQILQLYTAKARQEASSLGEHFAPRGSDTAKYQVGEVEYLDANSARVKAVWTDLDEQGKPQSDEALWMVRKEPGGWRVAAMAVKVFEGDEYLFLDFEDLNRTKAMLEEFRKEQLRRAAEVANRPEQTTERQ
ncbi:MAG: hypothetical protein NZ899_04320 [Thermoguttaceae bacterium]|nr:hypothetical protein [Thermoguttaceae bacterium]MDW8077639.1 hypothetical protein [Thermoguttaceae bacterium]